MKTYLSIVALLLALISAQAQFNTNRPGSIGGSGSVSTNEPGSIQIPSPEVSVANYTNRLLWNLAASTSTNRIFYTNAGSYFGNTNTSQLNIRSNTSPSRWEWRTGTTVLATNNRAYGTFRTNGTGAAVYGYTRYEPTTEYPVRVDALGALVSPQEFTPGGVVVNKPTGAATRYLNLSAAKTAASAGDVITATSLNVGATNLLKNGVDYDFRGVSLSHSNQIPQSAGLALAPFTDQGQGALTNTVKGIKLIDFRSQVLQSGDALSDTNPFVNLNALAAIYITNPAANIRIDVDKITHSIIGNINGSAAIYVKDCTNTVFNVGQIIDPFWMNPDVYVGKDEFDGDVTLQSAGAGVYWDHGEMTVNVGTIKGFGYGFYANASSPPRHVVENFWMTADEIVSSGNAAIYTVGNTNNYRMWITAKEVKAIASEGVTLFGDQRFYLTAQKISSELSGRPVVNLASNGKPEAWIVSEKITCVNGNFVYLTSGQAGTLDITTQHYQDSGTAGGAIGFRTVAGTNIIHGGRAKIGNGKGISHEGGRTFAENLYLDTATTTNAANNPVSVSAAGLILKDCVLIAPSGADSITAASAQTVTVIGNVYANTAKHANVTIAGPGTFTVLSSLPRL